MRRTVKVYRLVQEKNRFLGLEIFDLLILLAVYLVTFLVSANLLLNGGVILAAYLVLKVYKKGRPVHWTGSVIRYLAGKRKFSNSRELKGEIPK